jgi:hypothetical protein
MAGKFSRDPGHTRDDHKAKEARLVAGGKPYRGEALAANARAKKGDRK